MKNHIKFEGFFTFLPDLVYCVTCQGQEANIAKKKPSQWEVFSFLKASFPWPLKDDLVDDIGLGRLFSAWKWPKRC